ncbi:MAG: hypothetical protein SFW36_18690 [Leptolyngbyaceae cyanobacterium bins.59]|nr:hypothetical protein [Leptolyngbyaceae cyanobacterium bins.59]
MGKFVNRRMPIDTCAPLGDFQKTISLLVSASLVSASLNQRWA